MRAGERPTNGTQFGVCLDLLIGYVRVSTDAQDLTAQRDALEALGVEPEHLYVDQGLTGANRDRPAGVAHAAALADQTRTRSALR